jgi:uncharacterized protein YrrD
MQKVNDLYNKLVINQSTGEKVASVRDVVLSGDARRIVALVVGDGMWSNEERVIRWHAVTSVGDYVIVEGTTPFASVDEDVEVAELRKQAHQITGTMVVSTTGDRLGTVGDMFFNDRGEIVGYTIKQGMLGTSSDAGFLKAVDIQVVGKDAVIAATTDLRTMRDVERMANEPLQSAGEFREPGTPDLRERSMGDPREPLAGVPPISREPIRDVPLEPRERQDIG